MATSEMDIDYWYGANINFSKITGREQIHKLIGDDYTKLPFLQADFIIMGLGSPLFDLFSKTMQEMIAFSKVVVQPDQELYIGGPNQQEQGLVIGQVDEKFISAYQAVNKLVFEGHLWLVGLDKQVVAKEFVLALLYTDQDSQVLRRSRQQPLIRSVNVLKGNCFFENWLDHTN